MHARALGTLGERGMPVAVDLFRKAFVGRALTEYLDHLHRERNHQGKENKFLFPAPGGPLQGCRHGTVQCKERLGRLRNTTRPEQHEFWLGYYFDEILL